MATRKKTTPPDLATPKGDEVISDHSHGQFAGDPGKLTAPEHEGDEMEGDD